jgi:hypothetical protein
MTFYNSHNQYVITFLTWLWNKNQYTLPILSLSYFTLSCTHRKEYKNLDDRHSSFNTSWNLKKFSNSDSCCMTLPYSCDGSVRIDCRKRSYISNY